MADVSEFRYENMDQNDRVYLEPIKEALDSTPKIEYRMTVHTDQNFQYQNISWQGTLKERHVF